MLSPLLNTFAEGVQGVSCQVEEDLLVMFFGLKLSEIKLSPPSEYAD